MKGWLAVVLLSCLAASVIGQGLGDAWAEPAREGHRREPNLKSPPFTAALFGNVVWRQEIIEAGTRFIRIHFADIVDRSNVDYSVVIRDFASARKFTYPKRVFGAKSEFWTGVVIGDMATIEVVGAAPPAGVEFTIKEYSYQAPGGQVLSVIPPDEREPISAYAGDERISKAARAVAKLAFIDAGVPVSCTGFMIDDDLLLTNEHCVNTEKLCDTAVAIFGYERTVAGGLNNGEQYQCLKVVAQDRVLDYALLQIEGSPGAAAKWGRLELAGRDVAVQEELYMIQHPNGEPKVISRKGCAVKTPQAQGRTTTATDFGHLCDTEHGSSGSPVLDKEHRVVGLHHLGFGLGRWVSENRAVQIQMIQPKLPK